MTTSQYETRKVTLNWCPTIVYKGVEFQIIISEEAVNMRLREMAHDIAIVSGESSPVIVGVLNGGVYIATGISRELSIRHQLGFVGVSSYGDSRSAEHNPTITNDLSCPVSGKKVWLVEDIVETGATVRDAVNYLLYKGATEVSICCLLSKVVPGKPCVVSPQIIGFVVPHDAFVVGCGLDLKKFFREMPFIGVPVERQSLA